MNTNQTNNIRNSSLSYLALRQWLGILGLALPILVWVFNGFELKSSISHFYYSPSSVLFTGFMLTFGIFLIFYPGRDDKDVKISDNWVTSIGGIGAILTALIPTAFYSQCEKPLDYAIILCDFCEGVELTTPFFHNNSVLGGIHLTCATVFLALMGYMAYFRFTKGSTTNKMKLFFRFCAYMVWIPLIMLGFKFYFKLEWTNHDVYIGECISLSFFGIAWLVKGKAFKRFGFH